MNDLKANEIRRVLHEQCAVGIQLDQQLLSKFT